MEEVNPNKRKLDIDWDALLSKQNDEPPPDLIVKKELPTTPAPKSADTSADDETELNCSDYSLVTQRERLKKTYNRFRGTLPDKGHKILSTIERIEKELERRRSRRAEMDVDVRERRTQSTSADASDGFGQGTASSQVQSQSSFASVFGEKMKENSNLRVVKAEKDLSTLAHCDRQKGRSNGELSQRRRPKDRPSEREKPFKCASSLSRKGVKFVFSNGDQKGRDPSTHSSHHMGKKLSSCFSNKKDAFQVLPSNNSRRKKGQTLVLLDEDESSLEETTEETSLVETTGEAEKLDERMKDAKIYYPSRDDPESVEICYMDINHLAPAAFLTSPIMNFYIRYLQQEASPTNRAICDCHFFNTYFYKKLKEAVSYKGGDKDSFFGKFRRWWKGVNIFQKAYVLIPIHEDLHWSLVIISIPDKEDETGPIILHLDSLGLHYSKSVFDNIRSYLKQEWNYLKEEGLRQEGSPDLPISERIWDHLPRRIEERKIVVPQQTNEYDCGLFVLFFMERFIKDAPERLKKKDLVMFGKQWFRPSEASGLRVKIRKLLKEEFERADNDS